MGQCAGMSPDRVDRKEDLVTEKRTQKPAAPGFVVLQKLKSGKWEFLGEIPRRRGLSARAARSQAILDATGGKASKGDIYAAVLRSEWRIAMDWVPRPPEGT
jgi:hypothetical protein